jgi:hypothetical protein
LSGERFFSASGFRVLSYGVGSVPERDVFGKLRNPGLLRVSALFLSDDVVSAVEHCAACIEADDGGFSAVLVPSGGPSSY